MSYLSHLEEAAARARTRSSWNARLEHWQRPASDHEESKIQRAADNAADIVRNNLVLREEEAVIRPQGSYFNNTNVRLESDMDIRVQLPGIYIRYADGIDQTAAYRAGGYSSTGRSYDEIASRVRAALTKDCRYRFGAASVSSGSKAITVDGLSGSRADVDLVPAFRLHFIRHGLLGGLETVEGVVIFGQDSKTTLNFPEQHHANGISKRSNTKHRFKKIVRMLKRLNIELANIGYIKIPVPSFFVECLVYNVEDYYFSLDGDHFDRLSGILLRLSQLLVDDAWVQQAMEVNAIKYLFRDGQSWDIVQGREFILAAIRRLNMEVA